MSYPNDTYTEQGIKLVKQWCDEADKFFEKVCAGDFGYDTLIGETLEDLCELVMDGDRGQDIRSQIPAINERLRVIIWPEDLKHISHELYYRAGLLKGLELRIVKEAE